MAVNSSLRTLIFFFFEIREEDKKQHHFTLARVRQIEKSTMSSFHQLYSIKYKNYIDIFKLL